MGCVSSKQAVSVTPAADHSGQFKDNAAKGPGNSGRSRVGWVELEKKKKGGEAGVGAGLSGSELGESGRASSNGDSLSFRLGNLQKYVEGEQVAAGWPAWLSAVAGEAIHGWVPLRADAFEKLEKVGGFRLFCGLSIFRFILSLEFVRCEQVGREEVCASPIFV